MKIVVSVNFLPNYISLLIVGGLKSAILSLLRLLNIACRSTQNAERVKRFWRLHIVIKPLLKVELINSLSHWSVTLLKFLRKFGACQKLEPAGRIGDFGNFFNCFTKGPRVLQWSWILNECNLSWKIVKYCIL